MKPLYKSLESEEHLSQSATLVRIALITVANILLMSWALVLFAAGGWQNPLDLAKGIFPVGIICFAAIMVSVVVAVAQCRRRRTRKAIRIVAWRIPSLWLAALLLALGFDVLGEIIRTIASYFGVQPPCAFRWPPCSV